VTQALTSTAEQSSGGGYNVLTGFGVVKAAAALDKAGQLLAGKAQRSQVESQAHFGGGPAAVPAVPVKSRGSGHLVLYCVLALVSLALGGAGLAGLARTRVRPQGAS
jgi:hypothetical protein